MTDIEARALALLNEQAGHEYIHARDMADKSYEVKALCRAIERHEAFKQEVSDAAEEYNEAAAPMGWEGFDRFIIPKPDPLVEVLEKINGEGGFDSYDHYAHRLHTALEARGLEIRSKANEQIG